MSTLKTDFKDAVLASGTLRKYQMINNPDGTVSFQDASQYSQAGDKAQASVFNETNAEVNAHEGRTDNPHGVTAAQAGAVPVTRTVNGHALSSDVTVTASDVGLGNVNNTADSAKSVSYANSAGYAGSAGSAPANGGTAANTTSISGALTLVSGGTAPSSTLSPGTLWGGY